MQFKTIVALLVVILGSANLYAEPGAHRRGVFDSVRSYQVQDAAPEQFEARRPERENAPRQRGFEMSDSSGYGSADDGAPSADHGRRQGRLSPEERRALRRQIDEAGHDIYTPKR